MYFSSSFLGLSLVKITKSERFSAISPIIDLLDLSPRSGNALKREGYMKIKDLNGISDDALKNVKLLASDYKDNAETEKNPIS